MKQTIVLTIAVLLSACTLDGQAARKGAKLFARDTLGYTNPVINCQNVDSDNDGYVSCTVVDTGTEHREAIECSGAFSWNTGCRLATGKGR